MLINGEEGISAFDMILHSMASGWSVKLALVCIIRNLSKINSKFQTELPLQNDHRSAQLRDGGGGDCEGGYHVWTFG